MQTSPAHPRKFAPSIAILCAVAAALAACGSRKDAPPTKPNTLPIEQSQSSEPAAVDTSGRAPTRVEMVNVDIHLDPALILRIHYLSGQFLSTRKGRPPAFDDKLSYIVSIDSAEVAVSAASMTHALNTYVFNQPGSPLKNLTLTIEGNQIKQTGTLNKGPGIPFEMIGVMSPTADGKIRIQSTKVKAEHLPVRGLMKLLGMDMAKLMNAHKTKGVSVEGDDIILDPTLMLPPPMMRGRITAVTLQGDQIVQTFGAPRKFRPSKPADGNYMWYRGGVLQFGKLTMNDTDMQLIDAEPADPFDFFPDHYKDQLVAGYSKTTATGGLRVYMPDYDKISRPLSPRVEIRTPHRTQPASGLR